MTFKLSVDEDILSVKSRPGILESVLFFKNWTYRFELPMNKISSITIENRLGVVTMVVHKMMSDGEIKNIPISLNMANRYQKEFISEALPKIIEKRLPMPEIKKLQREYLTKGKQVTYL